MAAAEADLAELRAALEAKTEVSAKWASDLSTPILLKGDRRHWSQYLVRGLNCSGPNGYSSQAHLCRCRWLNE